MGGYISTSSSEVENNLPDPYVRWKPPKPEGGDIVLIPVDDTSHAETAFDWYVRHMHKPTNTVRLLYCVDIRYTSCYNLKGRDFKDELEEKKRTASFLAEKYYKKLSDTGVSGSVQTFVGSPGEVILDHAIRTNTSTIIMGSRNLGLIRRTLLGSISGYVVNHSKVPVTIVPCEA